MRLPSFVLQLKGWIPEPEKDYLEVVGLDLGRTAGLCVIYGKDSWTVKTLKADRSLSMVEVGDFIAQEVIRHINPAVAIVSIEDFSYGYIPRRANIVQLAEMRGALLLRFREHNIPYVFASITAARKEFFGRGNVGKQELYEWLKRHGLSFADDNQMDAFVAAFYLFKKITGIDIVDIREQMRIL